ncbi:MAG: LysR family transcriptional regulator, partial [Pseudomonadota bacterium]
RRHNIPSSSCMIAFECAARHLNFTRASEELNTSQSAVSRHISDLEARVGKKLFDRSKRGLSLTENGKRLHEAISAGLDRISSEMNFLTNNSTPQTLTITCSHEISHLYLMPRYSELQNVIGEDVRLNILTQEYDLVRLLDIELYDIVLSYRKPSSAEAANNIKIVLEERVRPLCSATVFESYKAGFEGGITTWPQLPLLELNKPNKGWTRWSDWMGFFGVSSDTRTFKHMTNYVYLLEAAAAGHGLVLGWEGLVDRYVENGSLVPVVDELFTTDNALCATLTKSGSYNDAAQKCLDYLAGDFSAFA